MAIDLKDYENAAPWRGDYDRDLEALQERLSRILVAHIVHRRKSLIVCEGWDASGKGGAIRRMTATLDPRAFRVWPIAAPSDDEKKRHFLWRFWRRLPGDGQIAIFDRSWYGRVLVERVEGLASEAQWRRAYDEINEFEAQLHYDGAPMVKLFFHVTAKEQDLRLKARLDHPWKSWKVGPEDFRNRARRADYLAAIEDMFERTDTRWAPWRVIDGNDKKSARIAALTAVCDALEPGLNMAPPGASEEVAALALRAFGKDDQPG